MFELRLLGALEIYATDGRSVESLVRQSKRTGLLAYLAAALPHGFHRRDKLLALFWPESDEAHARAALSQALYVLRNALEEQAVVTRGEAEVGLNAEVVWCDVTAFESALDAGRPAEALALYRGDLLDGFFVTGAPEFERWIEAERTRLKQRAAEGAWELAEAKATDGNAVEAERWARRAAELLPDDEAIVRRLMTFLHRLGDKAAAIRSYEAFAWRLGQEHELEPSPETQELAAAIRKEERHPVGWPFSPQSEAARVKALEPRRGWPPGRRHLAVGATVALGTVGVMVGALLVAMRDGIRDSESTSRVVVIPFENRTAVTELDPLGTMIAEWVTQGLTAAPFLTVLDTRGAQAAVRMLGAAAEPVTVGRETGAGVVVAGSYFLQDDSLQLQAQITSTADGSVLLGIGGVAAPRDRPLDGVERLRQRVLAALASVNDQRVTTFQTGLTEPPTYAAYREYAEGVGYYVRTEFLEAMRRFARAAALDSSFLLAEVWAAQSAVIAQYISGEGWARVADSLIGGLRPLRHRLSAFDRARLDYVVALHAHDLNEAYRAALRMLDAAPGSVDARREAALSAGRVFRTREALRRLEDLDPERGFMRAWGQYWGVLAEGLHRVGEYRDELAVVRRARRLYPAYFRARELRALAALGRVAELDSIARAELPAVPAEIGRSAFGVAGELMAHGHPQSARRLARYAAELLAARPPSEETAREWLQQHVRLGLSFVGYRGRAFPSELSEAGSPLQEARDAWLHQRAELALLLDDAEAAAEHAAQIRDPEANGLLLARILAAQGHHDAARAALEKMERRVLDAGGTLRALGIERVGVLVRVGELDRALDVFAEGLLRGLFPLYGQDGHAYPDLAPLWRDPRFQALIEPRG